MNTNTAWAALPDEFQLSAREKPPLPPRATKPNFITLSPRSFYAERGASHLIPPKVQKDSEKEGSKSYLGDFDGLSFSVSEFEVASSIGKKRPPRETTFVTAQVYLDQSGKRTKIFGAILIVTALTLLLIVGFASFRDVQENEVESDEEEIQLNNQEAAIICQSIEFDSELGASFCTNDKKHVRCDADGIDFLGDDILLRECEEQCGCPTFTVVTGSNPCTEAANICTPA